ncbi:hypothetical protein DBZ45_18905 [Arthrobacter globiformis]|uniref:DUF5671 domain-containing protein n=1 Tax=Arthrobacter globiformis TaxID=1665 RepID=A0A328HCA4_ARTGO|nr:hypothetical protein DBZ45_18905 [Arthrobacter globiformis]
MRRLVVFVLLFVLVLIGASGVGGLFERLLTSGAGLAGNDVGSLARSLAFALVGGSMAAVLWWLVWRRQGEEAERSSGAWGLYVSGVYIVALIAAVTAVLGAVSQLVGLLARAATGAAGALGEGLEWRSSLATGVVWAAVWAWHRWMWQHRGKGPRRLGTVPALAGSVLGLLIGAGGAVTALGSLLDAALRGLAGTHDVGSPWWVSVLQSLIWAGGGFLVWWWHWVSGEARRLFSPLANVAAAVFGVLGGCITAMAGAVTAVFVLLRLVLDRSEDMIRLVDPLGPALAAAAVGCLVWRYHALLTAARSEKMRATGLLLASGVAVAAAASGVGVVVNAALGFAETTLAGTGTRTLLLGGISALVVGGAVWWWAWQPADRRGSASADDAGGADGADGLPARAAAGRRIYLVAIFAISAVVALIALLVVGYQTFEHLLDPVRSGNLVGRIRAPLGLLTSTALVAAYHYSVWRRERVLPAETGSLRETGRVQDAGPVRTARRTIGQVVLVTGSDPVPLSRAIHEASGADVTVWLRSGLPAGPDPEQPDPEQPDAGTLMAALEGVSAERVLVVVGPGVRIDVIPVRQLGSS